MVNKITFTVDRGEREVGGRKTGKGQRARSCEASPGGAERKVGGGGEGSPGEAGRGCRGGDKKA